jgi:transcriptional regulator GlxA family with amidase domain
MSVNGFYAEIKQRLQSHYNSADKLVLLTKVYNPAEAAFLQKVNDIIFSNINDETFDANKLSSEICLSRTQLFRKLKNIIGRPPADYIRQLRLQKAKKLLETTDKRVGEVACETGFESMSHFTKVFANRYGFKPSELKRRPNTTN